MSKKALIKMYSVIFANSEFPAREAKKMAKESFSKAEHTAKATLEYHLTGDIWCEGMGDYFLANENNDSRINELLRIAREDGATDDDIRNYRNIPPIVREMALEQDELFRLQSFFNSIMSGMSPEEAAKETFKYFPRYGDPRNTELASGDDRPLPEDLKDRVNIFINEKSSKDAIGFRRLLANSTSMNAVIRNAIKNGEL